MAASAAELRSSWESFTPEQRDEAAALKARGVPPALAIRQVRDGTQRKMDTARNVAEAETQAELLTAEPTFTQKAASVAQGAADVVSLGLADEARGVLTALPRLAPGGESPVAAYERGRDKQREKVQDAQSGKLGGHYGAGEIAGLAGGVATGTTNLKAAGSLKNAIAGNAALGAAGGFGAGEGAEESLFLGTLGGLASGALTALPGGAQAFRDRIGRTTAKEAHDLPVVGKAFKLFDVGSKPGGMGDDVATLARGGDLGGVEVDDAFRASLKPLTSSDPLPVDSGDIMETLDVSRTMKLPDDLPSGKTVRARTKTPATPTRPEDALPARKGIKPARQAELDAQLAEAQSVVRKRALAELGEDAPAPLSFDDVPEQVVTGAPSLDVQGAEMGPMDADAFDDLLRSTFLAPTPPPQAGLPPVGERTFSKITGELLDAAKRPDLWSAQKQVAAGFEAPTPRPGTKGAAVASARKHLAGKGEPAGEPGGFAVKREAMKQKNAGANAGGVAKAAGVSFEDADAFANIGKQVNADGSPLDPELFAQTVAVARARGLTDAQIVELAYRSWWPESVIRANGLLR